MSKCPRGQEKNLLLLLMSIHHSGTKGNLQENLIRMSLTKGPRGEEINLRLLLMSIHHSGTEGSLQENLIMMSLTKGQRGEEINLLLLLMSVHHSRTEGSLQANLIRMSLKRLKEEPLAIKKETERKLHGLMLLMIWRSQIPIRIWREECKRLHWNHQFKWIKHHFPLDKIQFMI